MKKLILLLTAILSFQGAMASHLYGGEIWYEHDTLNTYDIHVRLYRDCAGINMPDSIPAFYSSTSLAVQSTAFTLHIIDTTIVNSCKISTCNNPASTCPGFEALHYTASATLPNPASDWYFYLSYAARSVVTNVNGGLFFIDASLDNLNTPLNTSAVPFTPIDLVYLFSNQATVNLPTVDPDGDSLDFYFTDPLTGNSQGISGPLGFQSGPPAYAVTNPFGSTPAPVLNTQTGDLTLYPGFAGQHTFAVRIDEYRNGVIIGSTLRDYSFSYSSNTPNNLPSLSGINNTTSFTTQVDVCPSSNLSFTVHSSDPDANDTTTIEALHIPAGATFTTNTAQNLVGTFNWTPTLADVRAQPYIVSFKVWDDTCAHQSYAYQVYVNHCNPDSVWAGDANADFTCDNYDVLNIGIANGTTGTVRPGATTNWQAEWCPNWATTFINNIDYKHADCNGDGMIDNADLAAVTANYGMVHMKQSNIGQYKTLGLPDLRCDVSGIQAHRGSTVSIPIHLGSTSATLNDFYGISATVELLNAQTAAPIAVSKNVSWIGNSSNTFDFEKSLTPNKSAFTFVRNNQQNTNGQGQIGEIDFPIDANSMIGSKVIIQFSNIKMIKNTGEEINDYNVLTDTLEILAPLALNEVAKGLSIDVYPNPTHSNVRILIQLDEAQELKLALYDVTGRLIDNNVYNGKMTAGKHSIDINLKDKAIGKYLLEIQTKSGRKTIPITKQ